jgi:hypothetical protein
MQKKFVLLASLTSISAVYARHNPFHAMEEGFAKVASSLHEIFDKFDREIDQSFAQTRAGFWVDDSAADLQVPMPQKNISSSSFSQSSVFSLAMPIDTTVSSEGKFKIQFPEIERPVEVQGTVTKKVVTNQRILHKDGSIETKLYVLNEKADNCTKDVAIVAVKDAGNDRSLQIQTSATGSVGNYRFSKSCSSTISVPAGFLAEVTDVTILDDGITVELAREKVEEPKAQNVLQNK